MNKIRTEIKHTKEKRKRSSAANRHVLNVHYLLAVGNALTHDTHTSSYLPRAAHWSRGSATSTAVAAPPGICTYSDWRVFIRTGLVGGAGGWVQVSGINPDFCYVPGIKIRWESGTGEKVRGTLFKSCHQPRLLYVASYVLLLLSAECTAPRSIKTNIVKRGWPRRQVILSSYYSTRASWQVYAH